MLTLRITQTKTGVRTAIMFQTKVLQSNRFSNADDIKQRVKLAVSRWLLMPVGENSYKKLYKKNNTLVEERF
jgi:hypothetical protein